MRVMLSPVLTAILLLIVRYCSTYYFFGTFMPVFLIDSAASNGKTVMGNSYSTLRCWEEGRLIYVSTSEIRG